MTGVSQSVGWTELTQARRAPLVAVAVLSWVFLGPSSGGLTPAAATPARPDPGGGTRPVSHGGSDADDAGNGAGAPDRGSATDRSGSAASRGSEASRAGRRGACRAADPPNRGGDIPTGRGGSGGAEGRVSARRDRGAARHGASPSSRDGTGQAPGRGRADGSAGFSGIVHRPQTRAGHAGHSAVGADRAGRRPVSGARPRSGCAAEDFSARVTPIAGGWRLTSVPSAMSP